MGRASKFGGIMTGRTESGERVSIKRLERYAASLPEMLDRLRGLERRDVARVEESFVGEDGCLYIVREFVEGTDLKTIFADKSVYGKIDERAYVKMGCGVLRALEAVHGLGIVHRDIKPSNIVIRHAAGADLTNVDYDDVALIDFEQGMTLPATGDARTAFALIYSPPEMVLKHNDLTGPTVDLFALAITIYHLVMGKTPYTDCNPEVLINLQLTYPMKKPGRMTDELYDVLSKAANKEAFRLPPRRLSYEEIHETLSRGIAGRYQTAGEMLAALSNVGEALHPATWWQKIIG